MLGIGVSCADIAEQLGLNISMQERKLSKTKTWKIISPNTIQTTWSAKKELKML